jgi:uncharacterized damage-inducible protein DinB
MNVKLGTINNAVPALTTLKQAPIASKMARRLRPFIRSIDQHVEDMADVQKKLFERLGEKDSEGRLAIKAESAEEYKREWAETLQDVVEVTDPGVTMEELENELDAKDIDVSIGGLMTIEALFVGDGKV